jgi:hypothetical protein
VGNRLDHANAEAFLDNGSAKVNLFEREGLVSFSPGLTFPDYYPDEPGASQEVDGALSLQTGYLAALMFREVYSCTRSGSIEESRLLKNRAPDTTDITRT